MKRISQNDLQKMYEVPSPDMEERIHQVIASLPVQVQEGKTVKRKWLMSAVLALVLILAVGAIGLAGSGIIGGRLVDFDGSITESEGITDVEMQQLEAESLEQEKVIATVPEGDFYTISNDEMRIGLAAERTFRTREEFDKAMAGVDYLTVPPRVPEGFELRKAKVFLKCRSGSEYSLTEERNEGKYTLKRYAVDETDRFISGYFLEYGDPADRSRRVTISSGLSGSWPISIEISEGETAEIISVSGMDKAMLVHSEEQDGWSLEMLRELDNPFDCVELPDDESNMELQYTKEFCGLTGWSVSADILLDMMQMGE